MAQLALFVEGALDSRSALGEFEANRPQTLADQAPTAIDSVAISVPLEPTPPRPSSPPPLPSPAAFAHPQANRQIVLDGMHIGYALVRSRRRTIGFRVDEQGLQVSAPARTPLFEIDAALQQKSRWIVSKLHQMRERQAQQEAVRIQWRDGACVPYLGQLLRVHLDPRQSTVTRGATLLPPDETAEPRLLLGLAYDSAPQQVQRATQAWLVRQARRLFTAQLDHYAPQVGVRWQRLGLMAARTRWGSASANGAIRLNWRLIHLPQPQIDYVVVHELAHLHEMNHSARFWQHVARVLPDYAVQRRALQQTVLPPW